MGNAIVDAWRSANRAFRARPIGAIAVGLLAAFAIHARAGERVPLDSIPADSAPRVEPIPAGAFRAAIEEDWLNAIAEPVTTRSDAAGACDGVKDGKYAFHTGLEPNPWWQVDLQQARTISRIVVYNRLDYAPGLHNADHLRVLTSDDGTTWTLRHDNRGNHFGGIHGAKPLEVVFNRPGISARFVRLRIPGAQPIFFHLDEVEIYGEAPDGPNLALRMPADQSSLSVWSTAKTRGSFFPTAACIERGRRLCDAFAESGLDVRMIRVELDALEREHAGLSADSDPSARRALYLRVRWVVRRLVFSNPSLDFDRLFFVKRFTQETYPDVCLNHMPWVSRPGGDLCILEPARRDRSLWRDLADPPANDQAAAVATVTSVVNGSLGPGHVHGSDLWWDAGRIVFGFARARSQEPPPGWLNREESYRLRREEEPIHIFEVGVDGRGLRQLTHGEWSDLDPTYLPDGNICFVSERCGTSLQCNEYDKDETSCNLYVMGPNGERVRRITVNKDGDYLPHCLDNGLIAYTHWEYQERSWAFIQSLWIVRPDGTGADAVFKQHFVNPWAVEDARSIPNSHKFVAIATGHHTLAVGPLVMIDPTGGINDARGIGIVTPDVRPPEGGMDGVPVAEGGVRDPGGFYATPWALSDKVFLVSYTYGTATTNPTGYGIYLVDVLGNKELIVRDPAISCFAPMPLKPRPIPPSLPDTTIEGETEATCIVGDVTFACDGVDASQARFLRISEPIGWPYDNQLGGQRYGEDHRYGGPGAERKNLTNWTPVRILGDVPVEPDGSAHFRVPADRAVYFQLLDGNRMELRRMRSFISFRPGEVRRCVGCHESRNSVPLYPSPDRNLAFARGPSPLIPAPWGDRPVSFLRDVQPVLDQHCVQCHGGMKPAGGFDLSGGLLANDPDIADYGHNRAYETILEHQLVAISPARAQDAGITPPFAYGSHRSRLIGCLTDSHHADAVSLSDEDRLRLVMWIDANAPYHDRFVNKRTDTPPYHLAADASLRAALNSIHQRRCANCHRDDSMTRLDWIDIRNPESSRFLAGPLARSAGGEGKCREPVYRDTDDADYWSARKAVTDAVNRLWAHPRRDVRSLRE
ncbi:MAG: hypothetical protein FJ297_18640 [Planctomycetes bacterium]|nr:hypothetical protein [Planctomycetota bacterium]